jgi:hypothetical protein
MALVTYVLVIGISLGIEAKKMAQDKTGQGAKGR